jgi:hypothetical protein
MPCIQKSSILEQRAVLLSCHQDNAKLHAGAAERDKKYRLEKEHWQKQLESKDAELEALREVDALQNAELRRLQQELEEHGARRSEAHKQDGSPVARVECQLEELANARSQAETQRTQYLCLQNELQIANEELQKLRALDGQRTSLANDHNITQDELARTQASVATLKKELFQAREDLKALPPLETKLPYLEEELRLARAKADAMTAENTSNQQELARSRATAESLRVEQETTAKRLENQLARADAEIETLRSRDQDRLVREEELMRLRAEVAVLRMEKQHWSDDYDKECNRMTTELEALRDAKEQSVQLQEELAQRSSEVELLRATHIQQRVIQEKIATEDTARSQMEDVVLQETLTKLKSAAPQRLKDLRAREEALRAENEALRAREAERLKLQEDFNRVCAELEAVRGKGEHVSPPSAQNFEKAEAVVTV